MHTRERHRRTHTHTHNQSCNHKDAKSRHAKPRISKHAPTLFFPTQMQKYSHQHQPRAQEKGPSTTRKCFDGVRAARWTDNEQRQTPHHPRFPGRRGTPWREMLNSWLPHRMTEVRGRGRSHAGAGGASKMTRSRGTGETDSWN